MRDLHQKLSLWDKLYMRLEERKADVDSTEAPTHGAAGENLSAMALELRAMNARTDTAFNDAMSALNARAAQERDRVTAEPVPDGMKAKTR